MSTCPRPHVAATACSWEEERAIINDAQSQLFSSDTNILCYDPARRRFSSFAKLSRAECIVCQATQDRTGPDWTGFLLSCRFFFCIQQTRRLLETNFVPVRHKRDFFSVSTILFFYWAWDTDSGILLCFMLLHCVHLCSCRCKCAHRVMRRCVLENETALSTEKQRAARFRDSCSLGRKETIVKAQGGNGEDDWGI